MTTGRVHKSGEPGTGGRRLRRGLEAAAGSVTLVLAYRGAASVVLALGPLALGRRNAAATVCTAALVALEASACDEVRWPGLVARTERPPLAGSAIGVSMAPMPSKKPARGSLVLAGPPEVAGGGRAVVGREAGR